MPRAKTTRKAKTRKAPSKTIGKRARRARRTGQQSSVQAHAPVGAVERVLAFDSSSKACGWSIFDNGTLVAFGRHLQSGDGHGERLMSFREWALRMFAEWEPHLVIYEAPYQGRMRNTFGVLSKYVAMIEAAHFQHYGEEIREGAAVPAHLVKKLIGAKKGKDHEANKKIVLLMVNQEFGLSLKFKANDTTKAVSQDDDADAIALNWAWHLKYRMEAA